MKIVHKVPQETADINAAQGTAFKELRRLILMVTLIAVAVFFAVVFVVDAIVMNISYETEARLFGNFAPGAIENQAYEDRLNRIRLILDKMALDPEVPELKFKVVLIEDPRPNALAFPGGTIGITTSLLDAIDEEIPLAFIVGHELGHFAHRDNLRGLGRGIGVRIAFSIVFGGEMGTNAVQKIFGMVLERTYSRGQEESADYYGADLVYRVYGETDGLEKLFEVILEHKDLPGWTYMFSTHPSPRSRIENLKSYVKTLKTK